MKRLTAVAMIMTFLGALVIPLQTASAGNNSVELPWQCEYDVVYDALYSGNYNVIWATGERTNGTSDNDIIIGTYGDDIIDGRGGNDIICGVDADGDDESDVLRGGTGNDIIIASTYGEDRLFGQSGNDLFIIYYGEPYSCNGGSGNDTVITYWNACQGRDRSIEDWDWR